MGQSVSFRDAAHTPADEKQKEEWEKKYHWEEPHLWDYPMLPTKMTEASCAKCHKQEVYVPNADKLNLAYATFERAGCYACHKTKGFDVEHEEARADPHEDRLEADAGLGEDLDPESARGQADDVDAALLVQLEQQLARRRGAQRGRDQRDRRVSVRERREARVRGQEPAARRREGGEQIVKSIGCLGCHVVGEGTRDEVGPRRTFGQPLENIGNKTTYEWIYNWVRDPKHYSPAHLHAEPAADRCAGGRCRDLSVDAERAGRRRGRRPRPISRPPTTCCSTT